jgi:hypothetical protein
VGRGRINWKRLFGCLLKIAKPFQVWTLFRSLPTSKFLHSLSITSILGHMHGAVNVYKK